MGIPKFLGTKLLLMENFDLREVLLEKGLKVPRKSVDRFLARIPSKYSEESGEVVFVEVFDSGEDAVIGQRYVCWVFSYTGAPLIVGKPDSEVVKAINNINWEDLSARLYEGVH